VVLHVISQRGQGKVHQERSTSEQQDLESVAEYFENIFNLQVADGSLAKKRKCQIKQCMRHKVSHKLRQRFNEKVRSVTEGPHRGDNCHSRQGNKYYCHDYKWQDRDNSSRCNNYNKHKKKQESRTPSNCGDKAFKPCLVHGPKSKHTSKECYKYPKNDKVNFKTKNANTRCITTMRAIQVMTMSCAVAPIHRSQVRTRRQPPARAKKP
jgi:hypothetical protein